MIQDEQELEFWKASYWDAVLGHDASMDGVFVYAVRTTGVYCRPSCPSRRPKRENVVFFQEKREAKDAGFRPCLRCTPDADHKGDPQARIVERVCRYIDKHLDQQVTLGALSAELSLSPFHLQRTFKAVMGITPRAYADNRRIEALKNGLRTGRSVTDSMYDAGYGSSSRLYEKTSAQLGMTPSRYINRGAGLSIRYALADSPVGRVLVAATDRGVCSIRFGGHDDGLLKELRGEFERAEIAAGGDALNQYVSALLERMDGSGSATLPLDIQATSFQRRVWEYLQSIPRGETRSYAQVADGIGTPKAHRAVARACASNPVAVAIPCHRVVRTDGGFGGYRWGVERKRRLLARERQ
jgi:AraC family transcriptional regulator of adaptative response/methylated-DNA-[protein]-cysteine methyltransferase